MKNPTKRLAALVSAGVLLAAVSVVGVTLPASATECVPRDAYTETIEHPAVGEPTVTIDNPKYVPAVEASVNKWVWIGGPVESAPSAPPSVGWTNAGATEDGKGATTGVVLHQGNGKASYLYFEAKAGTPAVGEPTIEVPNPDLTTAYTETIEHPAVVCETPPPAVTYNYEVGLYIYKDVNNQTFIAAQPGDEYFTAFPGNLPADVCGDGWRFQQDKVKYEGEFNWPNPLILPGGIGWPPIYAADHGALEELTTVPDCVVTPPVEETPPPAVVPETPAEPAPVVAPEPVTACAEFIYQEDAQAWLTVYPELDNDGDGVACEELPGEPVATAELAATGGPAPLFPLALSVMLLTIGGLALALRRQTA